MGRNLPGPEIMPQKSIKKLIIIISIFFAAITVSGEDADSSKALNLQKESDSLAASSPKKHKISPIRSTINQIISVMMLRRKYCTWQVKQRLSTRIWHCLQIQFSTP